MEALEKFNILDLTQIQPSTPWYQPYLELSTDLSSIIQTESKTSFLLTEAESKSPTQELTRVEFAEIAKRALEIRDCIADRQALSLPIEDIWVDPSVDPIKATQERLKNIEPEVSKAAEQLQESMSLIQSALTDLQTKDRSIEIKKGEQTNNDEQNTEQSIDLQQNPGELDDLSQVDSLTTTDQNSDETKQSSKLEISEINQQISEILESINRLNNSKDLEEDELTSISENIDVLPENTTALEDIACTTCPCEYTINENQVLKNNDKFFVILRNKDQTQILDTSNQVSPSQ